MSTQQPLQPVVRSMAGTLALNSAACHVAPWKQAGSSDDDSREAAQIVRIPSLGAATPGSS